jgi:predicted neuraminidase
MKTANALRPERVSPKKNSVWKKLAGDGILNQEPGVVQLSNGALMMWVRTLGGYMYKSVSKDNGLTWPDFTPVPSIVSPLAPQSIKRIPGTPRLLCVYNNHKGYNFAEEPQWSWRTPLSAAVSDDDGETWKTLPDIEDSSHNYCYTSILFLGGETLLSYYVSENSIRPDGAEERRNLASLKIKIINLDFLKGSGI